MRRIYPLDFTVKEYPSIWLHVDAAWAGVAMACPEYRAFGKLDPINQYATSYGTNFHKVSCNIIFTRARLIIWLLQWGLVNFDASMLWVRNRLHLTDALDVTPEFLRTKQHDAGKPSTARRAITGELTSGQDSSSTTETGTSGSAVVSAPSKFGSSCGATAWRASGNTFARCVVSHTSTAPKSIHSPRPIGHRAERVPRLPHLRLARLRARHHAQPRALRLPPCPTPVRLPRRR